MRIIVLILIFMLPVTAFAQHVAVNLADVHSASCRIVCSNPGGRTGSVGTGTVVALTAGRYWILTNWHVVDGFKTFRLEFFRDGKIFAVHGKLEGSWHNEKAPWDFAVLSVAKNELAPYDPPIIPLASETTKPTVEQPIYSAGCSEGRWAMAWKGAVESYYGETAQFYPAPKSGQSGSAIVQEIAGRLQVTGVLTWRVGDERRLPESEMRGGAIPISLFYQATKGRQPANDGNNVPLHSTWVSAMPPQSKTLQLNSDTYFHESAAGYDHLVLFAFLSHGCVPCQNARPVLKQFEEEGFNIELVELDTEYGRDAQKICQIELTPTFILASRTGEGTVELTRWVGIDSLADRIRESFCRFANSCNIDPLLNLYSGGNDSKKEPNLPAPEKQEPKGGLFGLLKPKDTTPPSSESGIVDSFANIMLDQSKKQIERIGDLTAGGVVSLTNSANSSIIDVKTELIAAIKSSVSKVIMWAVGLLVLIHFGSNCFLFFVEAMLKKIWKVVQAVISEIKKN